MVKSQPKSFNLALMQIVSPSLIIVMVAALVFFLIEVFYRGPHTGRLYWVMGLFTFAAVLVSRVSIEEGKERASLLGFCLAAATFVTASTLIEFKYAGLSFLGPVVTIGLIATVMWCSSKLTWDCTVVDRSRDPSATGLVDLLQTSVQEDIDAARQTEDKKSWLFGWLAAKPKKNNPGLWVFYFAIMAFPVFGFGQWFVGPAGKGWAFVLFAVYLAATLALLMTTSLLGLERYLNKRKLHVPPAIARNWLMTGGVFAMLVMLAVILIPKPPSAGWSDDVAAMFQSRIRDGSKFAPGKDGIKNDADANKKRIDPNAKDGPQVEGEKGEGGNDKQGDQSGGDSGDGKGSKGKSKESGKSGEKSNDQKQSNDPNKQGSKSDSKNSEQKKDQSSGNKKQDQQKQNGQSQSKQNKDASKRPEQAKQQNQDQNNAEKQAERQQGQENQANNQQQQPNQSFQKLVDSASGIFRFLVYLIGFIAAGVLIYMFWDQIAALFRRKPKQAADEEVETSQQPAVNLPRFDSFRNPFQTGQAGQMRGPDLLRYTLSALQAWSRDMGIQQGDDDTPEDLARRLKQSHPRLADQAREFASLYGQVAFGGLNKLSREDQEALVKLWKSMVVGYSRSAELAIA